jgi:hypothetical protein
MEIFKKCNVKLYFDKKKWNFGSDSAFRSANNGYYFTEGINKIQSLTKNEKKVLIIDEDTFFTTGETIKFLLNNDFDLACSYWEAPEPIIYKSKPKFEVKGLSTFDDILLHDYQTNTYKHLDDIYIR